MPIRWRHYIAIVLALCALFPSGLARAQALNAAEYPEEIHALYFPATGHNLAGGFLRYWWEHGQVEIFGYPISEEMNENGRTVQYFERARFEYFPEHRGTRYEVQLGLLGREIAGHRAGPAFQALPPLAESINRDYFDQTGHSLAFGFKTYWEDHNGLHNFGYPISEEFVENGRTVQYFERARFEWHPEAPPEYRVQLGHLGREAAQARGIPLLPAGRRADATTWTATLAQEIAAQRLAEQEQRDQQAVLIDPFQAVVQASVANIRSGPSTGHAIADRTYARHIVHVTGVVSGEPIDGDPTWYQLANGGYISATLVAPFTPPAPPRTWPGRWIDVNLSTFYITGYEGSTPLYSAIVTAGRENRTPTGVFYINHRVEDETMDSRTVGIPEGHPEFYYLEDVMYTQYFDYRGDAIHGNYWVHPSRFGRFSSNGCVGLMNKDAAWFWEFAAIGTPVHIHY